MTATDTAAPTARTVDRPQPIGLFDGPAGLLLVGDGDGVDDLLSGLAAGVVPDRWPAATAVLAAVLVNDVPGAVALLGDGTIDSVNRLVLAPNAAHLATARRAAAGDPRLGCVVDAAAYSSGLSDEPPDPAGLDHEFSVLALTVRAARALEFTDGRRAQLLLQEAVAPAAATGPVLHARVLAMLAEQEGRSSARMAQAATHYGEAASLLEGTDFARLAAHFQLERGVLLHQLADGARHHLVEAVRCYQSALLALDRDEDPDSFALANMNLGIAILAMPMSQASDQVRLGVAVQSLRAALEVYRPDHHPWEWSSCQMNLANALQYLPSTHQEDNLREAVDLYEGVLGHRSRAADPEGYARVLANQANALAHLGALDDAGTRYREARALFAERGDGDAVDVIDRQLAEIDGLR